MKYYRIRMREVCALLGVSPQTIRNYEKANLSFGSKDEQTGYRHYNIRHLQKLYVTRCLRQMGIPLKELGELCGQNTRADRLLEVLENNMHRLDRERDLQKAMSESALSLINSIREVYSGENPFLFCVRPGYYRLDCHCDGHIRTDPDSVTLMQEWSALAPLTMYSPLVPQSEVQEEFIEIGLALPETCYGFLSAKPSPLVRYYPPCRCLRYTAVANPQTWGYYSVIEPGMKYLEKHGFELDGDVLAVAFASALITPSQPEGADYYYAYIPYREKP